MVKNNNNSWQFMVVISLSLGINACQKTPEIPFAKQSLKAAKNSTTYEAALKPFGLINQSDAAALFEAYQQSQPNQTQTQFVSFKIKDLSAYLNMLSSNNQQEEVYVNFGQYSEQTSTDPNKIGRNTIFFSGDLSFQNNHSTAMIHSKSTTDCLEYLNHGQLYP
ncbi:MAG: hypothetical protein WCL56_01445 [Sediminibacterium sp.]|jgi:hypothetical protein